MTKKQVDYYADQNFNSIKVRLKHFTDEKVHSCFHHFNSIKVRLKHSSNILTTLMNLFQFHKGTIKTLYRSFCTFALVEFQFHKGTIKTPHRNRCLCDSSQFQFHKGTIKTIDVVFLIIDVESHFNSIKVRLKLSRVRSVTRTKDISIP